MLDSGEKEATNIFFFFSLPIAVHIPAVVYAPRRIDGYKPKTATSDTGCRKRNLGVLDKEQHRNQSN